MSAPRILAVGRAGESPEAALYKRYATRLRPPPDLVEISEGRGDPETIRRREGEALLAALPPRATLIALALDGDRPDSTTLARLIQTWRESGRYAFAIGGAEGLSAALLARANHRLSLGPLTWPHLLARVLLAEQLYRAQSITTGHPYHR